MRSRFASGRAALPSSVRTASTWPRANLNAPPIPMPTSDVGNLAACVMALKQGVESLIGQRGPASTRAVTFDDLVNYGVLHPDAVSSPHGTANAPSGGTGTGGGGGGGTNQLITLSGDATGSGTTSIPVTLATVNSNIGAFQGITINAKGLVTAAANQSYLTASVAAATYAPIASPAFTGNPTAPTASPGDNDASVATTAFVAAAVTAAPNKTITLSGDISGFGAAAITTTLATVNANVGTFQGLTINAKGQVTAATNQSYVTGGPYLPLIGGTLSGLLTVNTGSTANPLTLTTGVAVDNHINFTGPRSWAVGVQGFTAPVGEFWIYDVTASRLCLEISTSGNITLSGTLAVAGNAAPALGLLAGAAGTALWAPDGGSGAAKGIFVTTAANGSGILYRNDVGHSFQNSAGSAYAPVYCSTLTAGGNANPTLASGGGFTQLFAPDGTFPNNGIYLGTGGATGNIYHDMGTHAFRNNTGGSTYVTFDSAGTHNVSGSWIVICDLRIKKNVESYQPGLDAILKLNPVSFQYNGRARRPDDGRVHYGLIADAVAEALPELTDESMIPLDEGAEPVALKTYSPGLLVFPLINAIKELAAKNAALEARIVALEARLG